MKKNAIWTLVFVCILLLLKDSLIAVRGILWNSDYRYFFFICLGFIFLAGCIYAVLALSYRDDLAGLSHTQMFLRVLIRIPNDRCPAYPHVIAGVLFAAGVSLFLALGWAHHYNIRTSDGSAVSFAFTTGGAIFAMIVGLVSFYTLWQTTRLGDLQGDQLASFDKLIRHITKELRDLVNDFDTCDGKARDYHRFYLITTNPYFGILSYTEDKVTKEFRAAMHDVVERMKPTPHRQRGFKVRIICGDDELINQFNYAKSFPSKNTGQTLTEVQRNEHNYRNEQTKRLLEELIQSDHEAVKRMSSLPEVQFAVVGHVVYEFVLERTEFRTEIRQTRVIREHTTSDRYAKLFDNVLLKWAVVGDRLVERNQTPHAPRHDGQHIKDSAAEYQTPFGQTSAVDRANTINGPAVNTVVPDKAIPTTPPPSTS